MEKVASQKPNCVRTALQKQIDILNSLSTKDMDSEGNLNSLRVNLADAILSLENLEVALTDCYKVN